jgi:hypothetical protein
VNSSTQVKLVPFSKNTSIIENSIFISKKLLSKWKLEEGMNISICIGKQIFPLTTMPIDSEETEIHLATIVMDQLHLPIKEYTMFAQFVESQHILYLAPLIALITEITEEPPNSPNFRSIHSFCEELHHVTENSGGFFYVFPLQTILSTSITGYHYQDDQWQKSKLPLPDVIYNRIHSRKLEASPFFQKFRKHLDSESILMFNDRFLSKWDIYEVLKTEEHLKPYIPCTRLYSKPNLTEMLADYSLLFLKPIHGSQGRNIIRIEKVEHGYHIQFSYFKEQQHGVFVSTIMQLQELVEEMAKKSLFIIQQGIPLINLQSRFIDFRVLCHKKENEKWKVTSVVARLSAEQQFVSNISRGGEILKPLKALSLFFDNMTSKQLLLYIRELSLEFASVISNYSEGITGELGIDIGVDLNGHPWIIEANSKPSKNVEEQEVKIRPSAKAIISYCHYLAFDKYSIEEENG